VQKIKKAHPAASAVPMLLDLGSFASIRAFAKTFSAQYPKLDSLILNAGVMVPPFGLTEDGLETQIGTNHFGHHLLTSLLLPSLEAAAASAGVATVVAVSSAAHYDSYPEGILPSIAAMNNETAYDRGKAYGQSKLANVLFAQV
jgi:NAD(P)-dependent dehydrogenase (short-subunit alcohol dehydrogenase family)